MSVKKVASDWRHGTKRRLIAELAERNLTKRQAYAELRPLVDSQIKPMIFSSNPEIKGNRRIPKPIAEQLIELKNEIGRVYAELGRAASSEFESEETVPDPVEIEPEMVQEDEKEDEPVKPKKKRNAIEDMLAEFFVRIQEIREFCENRARMSEPLDSISVRPAKAAAKLIRAGMPLAALFHAMTMHWPSDARRDAGIEDFDVKAFSREIMLNRGIETVKRADGTKETPHEMFGYALMLAECRIPIMLIGPAGTGKSHLLAQLADYLGVKYGETPMSPGATRGDLLGRHTIGGLDYVIAAAALGDTDTLQRILEGGGSGGFISSEFVERFGSGGIFNFEEMDAADASMLIVVNNALESGKLFNSSSGELVFQHETFIAACTANTFGLGSNREYTAREKLDASTIDRWRMGRIFMALDRKVEAAILGITV